MNSNNWCNSCNCYSCDCSCGRKTVLQQSSSSCCTSSKSKFCKEPVIYLTGSFTVPVANVEVEVTVSNSARLYLGQGIQIGDYYFQVTEIVDSKTIKIAHNGTAIPTAVITAISATFGCYQYPIYHVGVVELLYTLEEDIEGIDNDFESIDDSVVNPTVVFTYGSLGPKKIQFNLEITTEIANTPEFLQVPLPNAASTPGATFSAVILVSSVPKKAIAYKKGTNLIVGLGDGTAFSNGTGTVIQVSGAYGI